ncbi:hypothetical protein ACFQ21_16820 [Ohtaekwangia kribbensis]|jgi:hypothetical protein|uniref:DUF4134 domain-containing protein n=1 Tax=Ohtaekwangia kribbensis TaxID=688913 RepID=A0ABW3K7N0_9BACT
MKATLFVILLLTTSMPAWAQFNQSVVAVNDERVVSPLIMNPAGEGAYKVYMPPGLRMRNAGRTLTIIGGAMLVGGVIVFGSADETYYSYNSYNGTTYEEGDPKAAIGILMMAGGLGMTIPGVILWTKGAKKYKRYLEQHEGEQTVSFNMNGNGVSLRYQF